MNRLTSVIGPAPSELGEEALFARLRIERERVRLALLSFKEGKFAKPGTKPTKRKTKAFLDKVVSTEWDTIQEQAAKAGMTPEELLKLIEGVL